MQHLNKDQQMFKNMVDEHHTAPKKSKGGKKKKNGKQKKVDVNNNNNNNKDVKINTEYVKSLTIIYGNTY